MSNVRRKKTKIVATISDLRCEVEFIQDLYNEGMNVVRINSAHTSFEGARKIVENTRKVDERIAILVDTKGPEIRTTKVQEGGIVVQTSDIIKCIGTDDNQKLSEKDMLFLNDPNIVSSVPVGSKILIDDGELELQVVDKNSTELICEVKNGGVIKSHKSINIPNVEISLPSLTERDIEYIHWAVEMDLDFIAHSFVRTKQDLRDIQDILDKLGSTIKIISKIENQQGIDNIDEILDNCYGVMVARGDLGVELPAERIPVLQRELVEKCILSKKPVIIATQMLHSMISNPRPTRAEVGDVANAVYQRADAIMLSGETAMGKYPVEAVKTMTNIALTIEKEIKPQADIDMTRVNNEVTAQLCRSAVKASINLPVEAILIDTVSGRTGRYLAAFRGEKPVYALCYRHNVVREMALSYGVYADFGELQFMHERYLYKLLSKLVDQKTLSIEDLVVVVGGSFGASKGASYVEISKVIHILNETFMA